MDFWVTDHRLLLKWTVIYRSSLFHRIGILGDMGGVSVPGVLSTSGGVGGAWWHCRAAVIYIKVLLLGCGAETMDRSVLDEANHQSLQRPLRPTSTVVPIF